MELIARDLRRDATTDITYAEMTQAMAVLNRIKENLQALEVVEAAPNSNGNE
jgi:MarR family transcriptional regulator, transcriptional regulator for hemolysin